MELSLGAGLGSGEGSATGKATGLVDTEVKVRVERSVIPRARE